MKIIISPAKQMSHADYPPPRQLPALIEKSRELLAQLKTFSCEKLKALLACNEALARQNYDRFQSMELHENLLTQGSAALLTYDGIQYKYMSPRVFEESYFEYAERHLRILSGLFGILRPFDAVLPYRLEMQARLKTDQYANLYDFWGDVICSELVHDEKESPLIINLASSEYSRIIERYIDSHIRFVSCIFAERIGNTIKEKGVYVKMARGEMVRFMAEQSVTDPEQMKDFKRLDFMYDKELSSPERLVFIRTPSGDKAERD